MKAQQTYGYPRTASVIAIIGGALMILSGILILIFSTFVLPGISNYIGHNVQIITSGNATTAIINNSTTYVFTGAHGGFMGSYPFHAGVIPSFFASIILAVGVVGLASGVVVVVSSILLPNNPNHRTLLGALVLIFSVVSFFGFGGFVLGAILGIVAGIMILTWKPIAPATPA